MEKTRTVANDLRRAAGPGDQSWSGGSRGQACGGDRGTSVAGCGRGAKIGSPEEPADHALGRSRGGFSGKVPIVCDNEGHPVEVVVSGGRVCESQMPGPLLEKTGAGLTDEQGALAA